MPPVFRAYRTEMSEEKILKSQVSRRWCSLLPWHFPVTVRSTGVWRMNNVKTSTSHPHSCCVCAPLPLCTLYARTTRMRALVTSHFFTLLAPIMSRKVVDVFSKHSNFGCGGRLSRGMHSIRSTSSVCKYFT